MKRLFCRKAKNGLIDFFFQASRATVAITRDTENYGRHPQEGCLGMCSGPQDPNGEVRGCCVGCTIAVSDVSASRVLQPRNIPSGVSRTKKMHFQAEVLYEVRRNLVFF